VPVVIVGTGSGLAYASLGATHHSCEEMGMLRLLPGLAVVAPADAQEVNGSLEAALKSEDPVYIRIGKKGEPVVHKTQPPFSIGKAITVREGTDAAILAAGVVLPVAIEAAELLAKKGISARVVSFHTVKPLDTDLLAEVFSRSKVVATMEEHSVLGGLGGSVAEWASQRRDAKARLVRFGTRDEFLHLTCEQEDAREHFGLTPVAVAGGIEENLR